MFKEHLRSHERSFTPHSNVVLFPQDEPYEADGVDVRAELARELSGGGFQVHKLSTSYIDKAKAYIPDGVYMWPRDCFMKSPLPGDNTVFIHPGVDQFGKKIFDDIMSEIGVSTEKSIFIPSFLATGGYSVYANDLVIVHEMLPDEDPGVQYLYNHGYTLQHLPTAFYEGRLTNGKGQTYRRRTYLNDLERRLMERENDHIDTEVGIFSSPDSSGIHLIVNETYDQGYSTYIDALVSALSRKVKIGVTVVPESEEQFLPVNIIQCPDGSIIMPAQAHETIEQLKAFYPSLRVRPIQVCSPFQQANGGGLRCGVNTF